MTTDQFQFEKFHFDETNLPGLLAGVRKARKSGKAVSSMLMEIAKLRFGYGRLKPDEYFMYQLYDDTRFNAETRKTFLSDTAKSFYSPWRVIGDDKPLMTTLLDGMGLPVPETQATYHKVRTFSKSISLRTQEDVVQFLREQAKYPLFGKPCNGCRSYGTALISDYDKETDELIINSSERVPVTEFAEKVDQLKLSYMFQTLLRPHPGITKLIGPSVSCVRFFFISDDRGCDLIRAGWKIPASSTVADNFWREGNMLAGVDLESGKIVKALQRHDGGTIPIDKHPETGQIFTDMVFPDWDEMLEVATAAAHNLTDCVLQGWDIALTDRGPVILELESDGGSPALGQLCYDRGVLDERFQHAYEYSKNRLKRQLDSFKNDHKKAKIDKAKGAISAFSMLKAAQEEIRDKQNGAESAPS